MKKNYIAPEAALVSYAAESMMAISLIITPGTSGEVAGSNYFVDFEDEWDEE